MGAGSLGVGAGALAAFPNGLNLMDPHVRAAIARVRAMAPNHAAQDPLGVANPWMVPR